MTTIDTVTVCVGAPGRSYWNILWSGKHPQRGGRWPAAHPCVENPQPTVFSREGQPQSSDALGRLRAMGYFASCFPEGDGISFDPPEGSTVEQVCSDITECFGWKTRVRQ